ncbi:hypothetical protein EJB05_08992, partial [Eragrostis curvula]
MSVNVFTASHRTSVKADSAWRAKRKNWRAAKTDAAPTNPRKFSPSPQSPRRILFSPHTHCLSSPPSRTRIRSAPPRCRASASAPPCRRALAAPPPSRRVRASAPPRRVQGERLRLSAAFCSASARPHPAQPPPFCRVCLSDASALVCKKSDAAFRNKPGTSLSSYWIRSVSEADWAITQDIPFRNVSVVFTRGGRGVRDEEKKQAMVDEWKVVRRWI